MHDGLVPAGELAAREIARWPNESPEYRAARTALLAEEIELRRHIEAVAEQRRALPPGPEVRGDYAFVGENGPVTLAELFGAKDTLIVYTWMFGPQRERPCPMCTSLLAAWDGEVPDIEQRAALAVTARSPIDKLVAFKAERGWKHLPIYSDRPTNSAATISPWSTVTTFPSSWCCRAATARSACSGPPRWAKRARIPARIRAVRPI